MDSFNQYNNEEPQAITAARGIAFLYLIGVIIPPFAPLLYVIGLIIAYIFRQDAHSWLISHYRYLIRTFWIGLLYSVIASLLCFVFIGFALIPVIVIWWIVRSVISLRLLAKQQAHLHPATWIA